MGIQCIYIKTMFSLKRHKQRVSPGKQKAWTKKFNIPYKWKHGQYTPVVKQTSFRLRDGPCRRLHPVYLISC